MGNILPLAMLRDIPCTFVIEIYYNILNIRIL